ncbi:MAG: 2Fe-2S iron-sulfur cluster binding domain-containing protein [Oligoflexia bacterium]|nr:2Fe-2S iron-sulfur cluster binding domain-containing protein [Oligoflexia bacterium]
MTRFGIRKRLKGLVGKGGRPEITRYGMTFVLPDGTEQTVQAEEHYTLAMASQFLPSPIATSCPDGQCGLCVVDVIEGAGISAASDSEQRVCKKIHGSFDPARRLACHARVDGDGAKVKVHQLFDYDSVRGTD